MLHLDANFIVGAVNPQSEQHRQASVWITSDEPLHVSAVAWGEFKCGPRGGLSPEDEAVARQFLTAIIPVTDTHAELAARLFNLTGRRSRSFQDCLVAASAIAAGARLATVNTTDFECFIEHGLALA